MGNVDHPFMVRESLLTALQSIDEEIRSRALWELKQQTRRYEYQCQLQNRQGVERANHSLYYTETPKLEPVGTRGATYTAPPGDYWRSVSQLPAETMVTNVAASTIDSKLVGRQGGKADPPDDDDPSESDPDEGESSHSEEEKKKKKKTKSRKKKKSHQSSESDSEEEVMSDRERLRRSRKAAPNTTTVAALVKTAVKLNANTDNYRAWLISMKETALYQG
jgi:hypothetical protein